MRIVWSEGRWLVPAAIVFCILALGVIRHYRGALSLPAWARGTAAGLKLLGFALLLLFLLGPQVVREVATPGLNTVAVVADNSASMTIPDQSGGARRGDTLAKSLAPSDWRKALEEQFQTRDFVFDAHAHRTENFSAMPFDGQRSALVESLGRVLQQSAGQPLSAIVVFTDGAATDFASPLPSGLPPVYPVRIAPEIPLADAAVEGATAATTVFENAPITVDTTVRCIGAKGLEVTLRLVDEKGQTAKEERRNVREDDETFAVRFLADPRKPGLAAYRVEADLPGDAIPQNNTRHVVANRDRGPFRILYVAGQPNWEHKFLQRALADDPEIRLVSLLRVARGASKFDWRAADDSGAHPFYSGQVDADEAERYDEPVFMRLGTKDSAELRDGFPRTAAELDPYDAIILDNIEAAFFSRDQLTVLREYVADRGGSLIMLGGADSLNAGGYDKTPLADVLPVYLNSQHAATPALPARLALTREGMLLEWPRLRTTETDELAREDRMPGFLVVQGFDSLKPGARSIAALRDAGGTEYPAIATQHFGSGISTAFMVGDLWRWGMRSAEQHADLDKFWRQTLRAAVADVPRRAALAARELPSGKIELSVAARGPDFHPAERATIRLRVATPSGRWSDVETQPDAERPGWFTTQVPAVESGVWRAEATVTDPADGHVSRLETGWAVNTVADEFRSPVPDPAPLDEIARNTGGRVLTPADVEQFVKELKNKPAPVMESRSEPLWHHAGWLALAICCFVGEWGLRRWKGLA